MRILVFLLSLTTVRSSFLPQAESAWSLQLSGTLGAGNAVVVSNRERLYVSTTEGNLHIVQNENDIKVYTPEAIAGSEVSCQSGVALSRNAQGNTDFAVYAVRDTPNSGDDSSSRIIAVDNDGNTLWSVSVPGEAVGTPFIGLEQKVYVVHNDSGNGRVSVIQNGVLVETTNDNLGPFAPPAGQTVGDTDILAFGNSFQDGRSTEGNLYMFVARRDQYQIRQASDDPFSGRTAPAISADGNSVYLGQSSGRLSGWTGNNNLQDVLRDREDNVRPRWSVRINTPSNDSTLPLPVTPTLSPDGTRMYVPGVTSLIYSIDVANGGLRWVDVSPAPFVARPVYGSSTEGDVVYFGSRDGTIRQYQADAQSARQNWEIDCEDCTLEADFAVSATNNILYYATNDGKLNAFRVGSFATEAPSTAPSLSPTLLPSSSPTLSFNPTLSPSSTPTGNPTSLSTNQEKQSNDGNTEDEDEVDEDRSIGNSNTSSSDKGLLVGLIILVIALALCVLCCGVFFLRRRKDKDVVKKERDIEYGVSDTHPPKIVSTPSFAGSSRSLKTAQQTSSTQENETSGLRNTVNSTVDSSGLDLTYEDPEQQESEYGGDDYSDVGYEMSLAGSETQSNGVFSKKTNTNYSANIEATKSISPPSSPIPSKPLTATPIPLPPSSPGANSVSSSNTKKSTYTEAIMSLLLPGTEDEEPGAIKPSPSRPTKDSHDDDSSEDESLFMDESVAPRSARGAPDDESTLGFSAPPAAIPKKSTKGESKGLPVVNDPKKAVARGSKKHTFQDSRRPRAGLFSRRSGLQTQQIVEEDEEDEAPKLATKLVKKQRSQVSQVSRPEDKRQAVEAKPNSSIEDPVTYISSTWNSFLNELSRAEDQFFNPTANSGSSSPPPPPPPSRPPRISPPSDLDLLDDDDSAGPVPGPPTRRPY